MTPTLEIVVVNWNSGQQLRECVSSISVALVPGFTLNRLIVVDNGSVDGSAEGLDCAGVPIRVIQEGRNRGFAKACNDGALGSTADFLLFLNPDTKLFRESLAAPIAYLAMPINEKVGVVGIQLLDEHGQVARTCARFPTLGSFICHALGLTRLSVFQRCGHAMTWWEHDATRVVDHVMGAFFLVRRDLYNRLSGFDEGFFVYLEDLDFSRRMANLGYQSVYIATVQAFHAGGGTSRQVKDRRLFYSLRGRLVYGFKHFGSVRGWCLIVATLLLEPVTRTIDAMIHADFAGLMNTWRAYGMLYRSLPTVLSARHRASLTSCDGAVSGSRAK
jgi:GT2 family glycosyltransferase